VVYDQVGAQLEKFKKQFQYSTDPLGNSGGITSFFTYGQSQHHDLVISKIFTKQIPYAKGSFNTTNKCTHYPRHYRLHIANPYKKRVPIPTHHHYTSLKDPILLSKNTGQQMPRKLSTFPTMDLPPNKGSINTSPAYFRLNAHPWPTNLSIRLIISHPI